MPHISPTTMYIIWAAAIIGFGILEAMTAQLVSIWFVLGSIGALIAAFLGAGIPVQIIVFIAITIITLAATRPIVKKKLSSDVQKLNADRCIGMEAVVTEEINNLEGKGAVKVDGKQWTARSSEQEVIKQGEKVVIEKIDGVKLIVNNKQ
ncbi:MAG: NfeD family protein [Eubacterium sp.]|nr:NfeD family protein [Eubacterium sp.]